MSDLRPVVVCVLGMHRSGTSLLARLLNIAGIELGAASSLARPAEDNPRGFWEHEELRKTNDALLQVFGGSWMDPPELTAKLFQIGNPAVRCSGEEIMKV